MKNIEKYNKAFMEIFELDESQLSDELEYQSIELWDSVGHMGLMAELEDKFGVMLDTDDIVNFASYNIGKEIFKKYDISM